MRLLNNILRFSQRAVRKVGNDLVRTANRFPVRSLPTKMQEQALRSNIEFKNRHKGQRCFVVGTGPSIKTQNLEALGDEITFVMNAFWQHTIVEKWQPDYHFLSDSLYFDGSEQCRDFLRSMSQRMFASKFFVPLHYRERIVEAEMLPLERTHWIGFGNEFHEPGTQIDNIDLTSLVPSPRSVSQLCIMAAMYMGCSPIYLLGLDHDWLAHTGFNKHFYEGNAGLDSHPAVKPALTHLGYRINMESQLILWTGYEKLREIAEREGCRIINATNGGFLDVFERANYEEVIGVSEIQN
jgi:hypothetical protein